MHLLCESGFTEYQGVTEVIEELIPIVMFICMAVVFIAAFWFRQRARDSMQQTIRMALDKGHELTPEIIDRLGHPKASKHKDLRLGVIWVAVAIGFALFSFAIPEEDVIQPMLGVAAFPFVIGVAYLFLNKFAKRDD